MVFARFNLCVVVVMLLAAFASATQAAGWSDDFNDGSVTDGSPVTWSNNPSPPLFDGTYDASSGDYHIFPNDATNPIGYTATWVDSVIFSDTYARTQGVVLPNPNDPLSTEGNLVLLARLDPVTITTYTLYFDVSGNLGVQRLDGLAAVFEESVDIEFNASVESVIELNVLNTEEGVELRGFAWQPDQPRPEIPQLVFVDENAGPPASGKAGLAFAYDDHFGTSGIYRYAMAQDTPFLDPPTELLGDYNDDGTVNAADYAVWRDGLGAEGGFVQADYDVWVANFGDTEELESSSAAVPEPASLVCVFMAFIGVAGFYRSRNFR